jgi:hypothetical protein
VAGAPFENYCPATTYLFQRTRIILPLVKQATMAAGGLCGLHSVRLMPSGDAGSTGFDGQLKLLLVGDTFVGKTSILLRFTEEAYREDQRSTVGVDLKASSRPAPCAARA